MTQVMKGSREIGARSEQRISALIVRSDQHPAVKMLCSSDTKPHEGSGVDVNNEQER